jgi:voltage-gated potassium channel
VAAESSSEERTLETGRSGDLSPEQDRALAAWRHRSNLPILLAAIVPLVVTSPQVRAVSFVVGVGSWLVFLVDLVVHRRIVPGYLHSRNGRIDLAIVVLTFPYYLIPGAGSYTAILAVARLARVARVLMATRGLRRLARQLGKVVSIAGIMLTICSLAAYEAERKTNPEFGSIGDAFWWGITTLTTVGYGDIVPETTAGRPAGVALMLTGIAVLGLLAGSLAEFFHLEEADAEKQSAAAAGAAPIEPVPVSVELTALQAQLRAVQRRLADLAERTRTESQDAAASGDGSLEPA